MAEETAFENGRIANFEGLVTLTLDQVILHTIAHHSSTSATNPQKSCLLELVEEKS